MKVLVIKESASYSSETIEHANNKFKIVSENGNFYSNLRIYIYTTNGELAIIAEEHDIPDYLVIMYNDDNDVRQSQNLQNLKNAEEYIKRIYSDETDC